MSSAVDSSGTSYFLKKVNENNPVVFIHGVGLNKEIWIPQINFFKNYTTLTFDLLGHGETPLKKSDLSIKDFSDQLFNLINELNFNKIHLVGFSLGALIARHFASEHNERLMSLILHGSIYKRTEEQKRVIKNRLENARINKPSTKTDALSRWLSKDFIKKNQNAYKKIYSMLEKNNHDNFLKSYGLFANYIDDDDMIKKIKTKTLVTTGENDPGSTPEMSKNLSKSIKGSEFIEIKSGKHLCSVECADDVNITFRKFIDKNNGQS